MVEVTCPCGLTMTLRPSEVKNKKHCSPECVTAYGAKRQPDPDKQITFNCGTCGVEVTRWKGYGATVSGKRFCSNPCAKKHTKKVRHYVVRESDMVLDSTWEMFFAGLMGLAKEACERYERAMGVEWSEGRHYAPDFYLPDQDLAVEVKGHRDPDDEAKWAAYRTHVGALVVLEGREALESLRRAADPVARLQRLSRAQ